MAFELTLTLIFLILGISVLAVWNYLDNRVVAPIKDQIESGYADKSNVHVTYLYVHKTSGDLKTVSEPRKSPVREHNDKNWEVLDIWWENPSEQ